MPGGLDRFDGICYNRGREDEDRAQKGIVIKTILFWVLLSEPVEHSEHYLLRSPSESFRRFKTDRSRTLSELFGGLSQNTFRNTDREPPTR
jgi:hypothetical protein